jgi:DHA2 family multidrug resistance protein
MLVTLLDRRGAFHSDELAANVTLAEPAVRHALAAHASLPALSGLVSQQAATMAFADAFYFLAAVTFVLTPLVFLLRAPAQVPSAGHAIAME